MKKLKMATPDKVLSLLLKGSSVKIDGREYVLDENWELCVKATKYQSSHHEDILNDGYAGEEVLLKAFVDLKDFIYLCASMEDDDYVLACADINLSQINREGGISRTQGAKSKRDEMYILPDKFYNKETEKNLI